jgi:copper chaperone CopZ
MKTSWLFGLFAALASSLCCIGPVLVLLAGTGGVVASFGWLAPWQPYLIGFSVVALGFAWYRHLRPQPDACGCDVQKRAFWESGRFLGLITAVSVLALAYPSFSSVFGTRRLAERPLPEKAAYHVARFRIEGMTCAGCEQHVEKAVGGLAGVGWVRASYSLGNATVAFDEKRTSPEQIIQAIGTTGYRVVQTKTPASR